MRTWLAGLSLSVLLLGLAPGTVLAQGYPEKPIRLVSPVPPSGPNDILARLMAEKLTQALGQTVLVENRAGAGGTIGSGMVARSAPDGYTLLVGTTSTHAIAPGMMSDLPYRAIEDFAPVVAVASAPYVVVVDPSVPAKSVEELIALAKASPGKLSYASAGAGTTPHLVAEMFTSMSGIDVLHVPYKGTAPGLVDVMGGRVSMMFSSIVPVQPHIAAGKLRAIAVTGKERSPVLPGVPTVAESGIPGFEATAWYGIFAPAGTPAAVVKKLNEASVEALRSADVRERLGSLGVQPVGGSPEAFADLVKRDLESWRRVIERSGAKGN